MERFKTVEDYFKNHPEWKEELELLRELTLKTEFKETVKWGAPTYTINGKNVMGIGAFKSYVGIWFFNGSFLLDRTGKLINAQDGRTKGLRQWRFNSLEDMDLVLILEYMKEAIENQKQGKYIKAVSNKTPIVIPNLLELAFKGNSDLKISFGKFSLSKQREFTDYIHSAKQEKTKLTRIAKIVPMILNGTSLYDKYSKK